METNNLDDEGKRLVAALVEAVQNKDSEAIKNLKYENLFYGSNLLDVVISYIWLTHEIVDFDFGFHVIKKGTKLYRIRRYKKDTDFTDIKEWSYPPSMPENRANKKGEPALYLGTTETVCDLETHIKNGEKYVLGEYEVMEDIKLGGFLMCEDCSKMSRFLAPVILNAFLIAPSRGEKNKDLFDYIDEHYKDLSLNDLKIADAKRLDLPLKFGFVNKKEEYYKITNNLIEPFKKKYPDGLFYSSCFLPLSTAGIICSDSNCVLYKSGMNKVRFINASIRIKESNISGVETIKLLVENDYSLDSEKEKQG